MAMLLDRLGFSDPDKKEPRHSAACRYAAVCREYAHCVAVYAFVDFGLSKGEAAVLRDAGVDVVRLGPAFDRWLKRNA